MSSWQTITDFDTDPVIAAAETVDDLSEAIANYLNAVAGALRVIALFVLPDVDIIKTLLNLALAALEEMITDLLQNNIAMSAHVNLRWDRDWQWTDQGPSTDYPNWTAGRDLPWSANGMDGWLLDVAASTKDESDPFRPLSDEETRVMGFIFAIGAPGFDGLGSVMELFDAFKDFSDFKDLGNEARLELAESQAALARAKQALFSQEMQEAVNNPRFAFRGDLLTRAATGTVYELSGKYYLQDTSQAFLTTVPNTLGVPDEVVRVRINGYDLRPEVLDVISDTVMEITGEVDPGVGGSISGLTWAAYEKELGDAFDSVINDWTFQEGSTPKWLSVPMARILPPVHALFEKLRKIIDMLKTSIANPLAKLAELLAQKAELLAQLAVELGDIIEQIILLATLLEGGRFFMHDTGDGGMDAFIGDAIRASEKPDYGPNGIVAGVVGVVTADNPISHFEGFWDLLGVTVSDYRADQGQRIDQIGNTFDDASAYF
jgi:hypothetical protein